MDRSIQNILRNGILGALTLAFLGASSAHAQGKGKRVESQEGVQITLSVDQRDIIREFYDDRSHAEVQPLPPGIRKRLERGKPLPPGIAKRYAPESLRSRIGLPEGYRVVEAGLDVVLIHAATQVVQAVLRDVLD